MTETPTGPSKAVARYDGPRSITDLREYALLLAFDTNPEGLYKDNQALPRTFRGNPGAVAFAVEYAKALDVSPTTAIMGVHMIDGKLSASSGLISGLIRRAGHKIRTWSEGSVTAGDFVAITTIVRADDPDFTYESRWDLDRAVRARLLRRTDEGRYVATKEKSGWDTYPENMAKARSITECARDAAEDAVLGVHYTPEELGAEIDAAGEPIYNVTQVPEQRPEPRRQDAQERPQEPPTPTPAPTPTAPPAAPQNDAAAEGPDLAAIADECRTRILTAKTATELTKVWSDPRLINSTKSRAEVLMTADERFVECSVFDLFGKAGRALRDGGAPLVAQEFTDADGQRHTHPAAVACEDVDCVDDGVRDAHVVPEEGSPEPGREGDRRA